MYILKIVLYYFNFPNFIMCGEESLKGVNVQKLQLFVVTFFNTIIIEKYYDKKLLESKNM